MTTAIEEKEWNRDYTTFMRCDAGDDWLPEVESQLGVWLRQKGFDVDLKQAGDHQQGNGRLAVRRVQNGKVNDLRLTLVETGDLGTWTTELVAHDEPGAEDWIHLQVTNDEGRFVKVPRVARYLMQVLPLADGTIDFTDRPHTFGVADVDRLVGILSDDKRHGLVFVAGTSDEAGFPIGPFVAKVADWTHEVYGLAQVVVLDPAATQEFAARVGPRFQAPAWAIRTYQPGVKFGSDLDARNHRILGTKSLGTQSDGRIRYLLGDVARNQAARRNLPDSVRKVRRRFDRIENSRLVEAIERPVEQEPQALRESHGPSISTKARPQPLTKARDLIAELALVKRILGIEEITEARLRQLAGRLTRGSVERESIVRFQERIDALQSKVEQLEDQHREALGLLDDAQMEHEMALIDLDRREGRLRWLETRLKEKGDFEMLHLEVPEEFRESRPAHFEELLERIELVPGVEFTGDADEVLRLQAIDTNEAALRTAWDAVLTIADYVRARADGQCDHGLTGYLDQTPSGYRTFPPGKYAASESAITMKSFGDERVFPVPTTVDPSGQAAMKAHFKLACIGMVSPRMHIFDGHPDQPIVYIGYIGPHLTNTQSN